VKENSIVMIVDLLFCIKARRKRHVKAEGHEKDRHKRR